MNYDEKRDDEHQRDGEHNGDVDVTRPRAPRPRPSTPRQLPRPRTRPGDARILPYWTRAGDRDG